MERLAKNVKFEIALKTPIKDLPSLCRINKLYQVYCDETNDFFWMNKVNYDFPDYVFPQLDRNNPDWYELPCYFKNWKELYKLLHWCSHPRKTFGIGSLIYIAKIIKAVVVDLTYFEGILVKITAMIIDNNEKALTNDYDKPFAKIKILRKHIYERHSDTDFAIDDWRSVTETGDGHVYNKIMAYADTPYFTLLEEPINVNFLLYLKDCDVPIYRLGSVFSVWRNPAPNKLTIDFPEEEFDNEEYESEDNEESIDNQEFEDNENYEEEETREGVDREGDYVVNNERRREEEDLEEEEGKEEYTTRQNLYGEFGVVGYDWNANIWDLEFIMIFLDNKRVLLQDVGDSILPKARPYRYIYIDDMNVLANRRKFMEYLESDKYIVRAKNT